MVIFVSREVVCVPDTTGSLELYYVATNLSLSQTFVGTSEDIFVGTAWGDRELVSVWTYYAQKFIRLLFPTSISEYLFLQYPREFDSI
jgi:hypothetical protein